MLLFEIKENTLTFVLPIKEKEATFDLTIRKDGVWQFADDNERSVLDVLEHDSDRSVAIVIGSMVEIRLKNAILARCRRDAKVEERLWQSSGPLGSFSVKIDLALMLGLVSPAAHQDLIVMKNIRNRFAHHLNIKDFRSQQIRNMASHFALVETHIGDATKEPMNVAVFGGATGPRIWVQNLQSRKKIARDRYLMTAQLFLFCLAPAEMPNSQIPFL
jgi:mannitol repressor